MSILGERTKAHWDKSPLGQKPTGQYPTGQKPTAKFGRVDKSPLLWEKIVYVFYKTVNPDQTAPSV